jgi:hypothetical protein
LQNVEDFFYLIYIFKPRNIYRKGERRKKSAICKITEKEKEGRNLQSAKLQKVADFFLLSCIYFQDKKYIR